MDSRDTIVTQFEEWMLRDLSDYVSAARASSGFMALFDLDEDRVHRMIAYPIFQRDQFFGVVCIDVRTREIQGMLIAVVTGMPFAADVVTTDVFQHVKPGAKHETAASLLEAYEKWARRIGAKKMVYTEPGGPEIDDWANIGVRRVKVIEKAEG